MKNKIHYQDLIVFENDNYLVINKPAFVSTLEDRNDDFNILSIFRAHYETIFVCHRLDKETTGALLLAKSEDAFRHAAMQFESREVDKVYHALVYGHFEEDTLEVDVPLKVGGSGTVRIDKRKGKEATTIFRLGKTISNYSLVEAKPISGRRHQIRVHLAYLNFPICGDTQYGGKPIFLSDFKKKYRPSKEKEERPLFNRVALHARSLKFLDLDRKVVEITCDYPKDIQMIMNKLEKFG
ncbi:MAG: RNA pseudouridine synthase [Reichenbachiella sp.]